MLKLPGLKPLSGSRERSIRSGENTQRRRAFWLTFSVEEREGVKFDQGTFVHKLRAEIVKEMGEGRVSFDGGTSGNHSSDLWSCDLLYSKEERYEGSIDLTLARVEGNRYLVWCVIREMVMY
jgi:hypothetical protein